MAVSAARACACVRTGYSTRMRVGGVLFASGREQDAGLVSGPFTAPRPASTRVGLQVSSTVHVRQRASAALSRCWSDHAADCDSAVAYLLRAPSTARSHRPNLSMSWLAGSYLNRTRAPGWSRSSSALETCRPSIAAVLDPGVSPAHATTVLLDSVRITPAFSTAHLLFPVSGQLRRRQCGAHRWNVQRRFSSIACFGTGLGIAPA
eukprot:1595503-Rhodomonas_salina.4